jgi:hypothetical protein
VLLPHPGSQRRRLHRPDRLSKCRCGPLHR